MVTHSMRREAIKERLRVKRDDLKKAQHTHAQTCLLKNYSTPVTSDLSGVLQTTTRRMLAAMKENDASKLNRLLNPSEHGPGRKSVISEE